MIAVVAGAGFLQAAVLDRGDAGPVIVVILTVHRFGEGIEGAVGETFGPALLYLDGAGVERRVSEIGPVVDIAVVREGAVVLRGGEHLVLQNGVSFGEVDGEGIDVPAFDQTHAG